MNEELLNYILSLTPDQVDKVLEHLDELKELCKEEQEKADEKSSASFAFALFLYAFVQFFFTNLHFCGETFKV